MTAAQPGKSSEPAAATQASACCSAWHWLAVALLLGSISWTAWTSLAQELNSDAGYYALHTRNVAEGQSPYIDFPYLYTPAFLYVQQGLDAIFGASRMALHLEVWLQHLVLCCLLMWALRRLLSLSAAALMVSAAFFFADVGLLDGSCLLLEPQINLWGWLGICLALESVRSTGRAEQAAGHPASAGSASIAFLAGLAAAMSAFTKQVGLGPALVAFLAPGLVAGRFERRTLGWMTAGLLVPPAVFFGLHPHLLLPFLQCTVGNLIKYTGESTPGSLGAMVHIFLRRIWIPGLLGLAALEACFRMWARRPAVARWRGGPGDWGRDALMLVMSCVGLVLYVPFVLRGYLHYLQLVLPFAIVAANYVFLAVREGPSKRHWLLLAPLLSFAVTFWPDMRILYRARVSNPTPWQTEADAAAFIASRAPDSRRVLVLPASPQLYLLAGKRDPSDQYKFFPSRELVEQATDRRLPVFVFQRNPSPVTTYLEMLQELGYREVERANGRLSFWLPAALSPTDGAVPGKAAQPPLAVPSRPPARP